MWLENFLAKLFTVSPSVLTQADTSLVCGRPVSPAHRGWWAGRGEAQVPQRSGPRRRTDRVGSCDWDHQCFASSLSSTTVFGDIGGHFALVLLGGFSASSHVESLGKKETLAGER